MLSPSILLSLFSLTCLLTLLPLSSSAAKPTTISLSLSTTAASPRTPNTWQKLNHLATSSATRAHHLKHPKTNTSTTIKTPLFPRGYGGYSVSLSFGTPPQNLSFVMDTGSSLVWFPCTERYTCNSCNFVGVDSENIPVFVPRASSSSKIVGCKNPKCKWVFPNVQCKECDKNSTNCNEFCPPYMIQYGSGSTTGLLLSESLVFTEKTEENFVAGCSVFSSMQPSGIVGFGRGAESLPAQMGLSKFSYCLVSHRFDDTPESSDLILYSGGGAAEEGGGIDHTPFRKNPTSSNPAFQDYYYVTLRKITVGGVNVKAPYKFLIPDSSGNGGTIVDSGTTFTFVENQVYELIAQEFENQVSQIYSRVISVEQQSGLRPCFNVSGQTSISLPQLTFHFKGGAKMELPLADYFSFLEDSVICMTIVTSGNVGGGGGVGPGPAIILGNYQQQNFYVEYDLENERLGFRKQLCNKSG